ncbi:MAG: oxidoreductase [Gemmatimonadetes bacterium]|nr:oxidoreductase [Gemmatimonadota bacterium]|tara:strand:- start:2984 stop:3775 length:792 start_codon:yes stop_codon:yes gene_type:complete
MTFAERYGPWALVTGASSGIGAEFARQLAGRGLDIVLVARRPDRLEAVSEDIRTTTGRATRIINSDLTAEGGCQRVIEESADLEVGLLVNNAGFGMSGGYHQLEPERQVQMTVLNCVAPVLLTNHYLPKLKERGRGGLIFLASLAGYQATASFATYGATKAFALMIGEALWKECREYGVNALAVSPGFTQTEFTDVANIRDAGLYRTATADSVVRASLRHLGRRPSFVHGPINKLLAFASRFLPRRAVIAITHASLRGRSNLE